MISLTKQEKYVLIFVVFTGALGTGLLFYNKASGRASLQEPVIADKCPVSDKSPAELKPVNINTALEKELASLDGIGPALAAEIVKYRLQNGNFYTIEDITEVKGIGPAKFERIKGRISIE